jgi:hypothetical protein
MNYINMSVDGLSAMRLMDPEIDLNQDQLYLIHTGAEYKRFYQEISSSFSNNQINFSIVPPSKDIIVSRHMYIECDATFRFTAGAGGGDIFNTPATGFAYYDNQIIDELNGLRFMPLHSVATESLSCTLNQTTITQQLSEYLEALTRTGWEGKDEMHWLSGSLAKHDVFQEYQDSVVFGTNRNPLAPFGEDAYRINRGGAIRYELVQGGANDNDTQQDIRVRWYEPVMLPPFCLESNRDPQKGLIGITNIDFTYSLGASNLSRMWSRNEDAGKQLNAPPQFRQFNEVKMHVCYLTPPLTVPIPLVNKYPYTEVKRFVKDAGAPTVAGDPVTLESNNVQLYSVPKRIAVFVRERNADRSYSRADCYARIDRVRVQFQNKNALLGSAQSYDLWQMSSENGLDMSWAEWSEYTGSVLILDCAKDLSLYSDQSADQHGQYQFQISVDATNINQRRAIDYALYFCVLNDGSFTVEGTATSLQTAMVRPEDVLAASNVNHLQQVEYHEVYNYVGGSFMGKLKKVAHGVGKAIHKGAQVAHSAKKFWDKHGDTIKKVGSTALRAAEFAAPLLLAAGYSDDEVLRMTLANAQGAGIVGAGMSGGVAGLTGGMQTGRSRLRSRS